MDHVADELLVAKTLEGDRRSFEVLVERYQTLVCSIAYAITGDFVRSEDVGQESLVEAWRQLDRLDDKSKFKSWLCSIARNMAHNSNRSFSKMQLDEYSESFQDPADSAEDRSIRDEEANLVWTTLQELPEQYREPLILFYRQEQSIAQVAESLDLSADVVKQRLSRGRKMLREEVTATVERALRSTVPSRAFTVAVLAATGAIGSKTASAATTATAATTVAAQAVGGGAIKSAGLLGATVGPLIGLVGAFFGSWCSWMTSRYESQRSLIVRSSILYLIGLAIFLVPFIAMHFGWQPWLIYGRDAYALMLLSWMGVFMAANFAWMYAGFRAYNELTRREVADNTQPLPQTSVQRWMDRYEGRRWTSQSQWLGAPLVDIAFSSPGESGLWTGGRVVARGWIAIGDFAVGRLIALGNVAAAPIALGTISIGIISVGVLTCGILSLGIISAAVLTAGIIAAGVFAMGVVSIGYLAAGVVAIAWQAAKGVVAIAYHYADGEVVVAAHGGDAAAKEYIANSWFLETSHAVLVGSADWMRFPTSMMLIAAFSVLLAGFIRFAYRRKAEAST